MSQLRNLVRQEILAREPLLIGTSLADPEIKNFDGTGTGGPVWVIPSVSISGQTRPLKNVIVKAGSDGSRNYAKRGSPIMMRRNARGRYEAVGPGDRVTGTRVVKKYPYGVTTASSTANEGVTFRVEPFEYYQGTGGNSLWNDGTTPFPKVTTVDADGNPIV